MQLLTIYIIKAICLSFPFLLIPIHWFSSPFLFFPFPLLFPPSAFADGLFGRRKGRELCQLWVYSRGKEKKLTQAESRGAGLVRGIYRRNATRRCRYSTGTACVCVCVFEVSGNTVVICSTRLWVLHDLLLEKYESFHCSTEDLQCIIDGPFWDSLNIFTICFRS